jgi:hypothetical protein
MLECHSIDTRTAYVGATCVLLGGDADERTLKDSEIGKAHLAPLEQNLTGVVTCN